MWLWYQKNVIMMSKQELESLRNFTLLCLPSSKYSYESWTLNKELSQRINAFEQWCYRRLLKIKWTDMISNEEVLQRMKEKEGFLYYCIKSFFFFHTIVKQKMPFAGHVLRGSSGDSAIQILEGKLEGKIAKRRPRRIGLDWTKLVSYASIKQTA